MKPKVQLILRYNLGFIGFLVVFHRPGCQLHNLAVPYLGYYILLSLSKAMCNLIYEKFTIYKQLLNPWFESSLFFFIFFFSFFFPATSLVCVSSSDIRQGVWVRADVSLVGNELIKNPDFL